MTEFDSGRVIRPLQKALDESREMGIDAVLCSKEIVEKVIELLKKQEAKPMTEYDDGWDCPRCGLKLVGKTASGYPCDELDLPNDEIVKYCPVCGQAVKWEC